MLFPQELLDTVVFIGERTSQGFHWGGTGFFVSAPSRIGPEEAHILLVTAQHCVGHKTGLVMRVNGPEGATVLDLPPGEEWHRHPGLPTDEDESDVAVTLMSLEDTEWLHNVAHRRWVPISLFLPDEPMSDDPTSGVGVGDEVVAFGLLSVHTGTDRSATVARTGNVAMLGHESIRLNRVLPDGMRHDIRMRLYLTEIRSIHGESGSPVFVRFRQPAGDLTYQVALLGVLVGHWEANGENLGIGQVVPAFRLRETLIQEATVRDFFQAEQRAQEVGAISILTELPRETVGDAEELMTD